MKLLSFAGIVLACAFLAGAPAHAGSINGMQQVVVCDPTTNGGLNCLKPAADGSLATTGGGGGGGGAITAASGAYASGALTAGSIASGAAVDGAIVTLGSKADAKSAATDTTSITIMQVLKQISASAQGSCNLVIPISQTTSTDLHTSSGKSYLCSIILIVPDAEVVSIIEGTGTVCATGTAAVIGNTTAANGMSLSANGGFTAISGIPWLSTQTTNDHLCLLQSGTGRIAGVITYNDH